MTEIREGLAHLIYPIFAHVWVKQAPSPPRDILRQCPPLELLDQAGANSLNLSIVQVDGNWIRVWFERGRKKFICWGTSAFSTMLGTSTLLGHFHTAGALLRCGSMGILFFCNACLKRDARGRTQTYNF